jgi:hypothetical protein
MSPIAKKTDAKNHHRDATLSPWSVAKTNFLSQGHAAITRARAPVDSLDTVIERQICVYWARYNLYVRQCLIFV